MRKHLHYPLPPMIRQSIRAAELGADIISSANRLITQKRSIRKVHSSPCEILCESDSFDTISWNDILIEQTYTSGDIDGDGLVNAGLCCC